MEVKEIMTFVGVGAPNMQTMDLGGTIDETKPILKTQTSQVHVDGNLMDMEFVAEAFAGDNVTNAHLLIIVGRMVV